MDSAVVDVVCDWPAGLPVARTCADALGCEVNRRSDAEHELHVSENGVILKCRGPQGVHPVKVDFTGGKAAHRRKFGGGKSQLIAKAIGLQGIRFTPHVLDATAGLGGDAFVLASLGCRVTMAERSPIAYALLNDGLRRARQVAAAGADEALSQIVERMHLLALDSRELLVQQDAPVADVIYLDPMFPARNKSAAVKKEMQAFHNIIGGDLDADALLELALVRAEFRVVVKRPRLAEPLGAREPGYRLTGKTSRFDIYPIRSMAKCPGETLV